MMLIASGLRPRGASERNAEIALCRSQYNQASGGQKVKHGRHARKPKR